MNHNDRYKFERMLNGFLSENTNLNLNQRRELYAALCNTTWRRESDGVLYDCTFRHAAMLVCKDDYTEVYCSGNEGRVQSWVEKAFRDKGWLLYQAN